MNVRFGKNVKYIATRQEPQGVVVIVVNTEANAKFFETHTILMIFEKLKDAEEFANLYTLSETLNLSDEDIEFIESLEKSSTKDKSQKEEIIEFPDVVFDDDDMQIINSKYFKGKKR